VKNRVLGRLGAYEESIVVRQPLLVGLVLARVTCPLTSAGAMRSGRKREAKVTQF
jgi:hypothetical protein